MKKKHGSKVSIVNESVRIPLAQLESDPKNPNYMAPEQLAQLTAAIGRVGFLDPCLVRELPNGRYVIIDGHHRVRAASEAGLSEVPCIVIRTDDAHATLLQIGMNKMRGELNLGEVAKLIGELDIAGFDLPEMVPTGFSNEEIESLLQASRVVDEEEVLETGSLAREEEQRAEEEPGGPFELTIPFATKSELQRAKRGLRKVAGKGRELGEGLLSLLESQE
jgi:ParB-like chromosome segregation protein Spo0J